MNHRAHIRFAAGAATTIALGALTALGTGTAAAAPATITWTNGATTYTRTVSDVTPAPGETVTVSTALSRTDTTTETVNWFKDWHPTCLSYVAGSATMTDNSGAHAVEPYLAIDTSDIAGDFTATSYRMIASNTQTATFSAQYTVGAGCATGTALTDGIEYLSSLGHVAFTTQGPSITVTPAVTTSTVTATSTTTVPVTTTAPTSTTVPVTTTTPVTSTSAAPQDPYGAMLTEVLNFLSDGSSVAYHP